MILGDVLVISAFLTNITVNIYAIARGIEWAKYQLLGWLVFGIGSIAAQITTFNLGSDSVFFIRVD